MMTMQEMKLARKHAQDLKEAERKTTKLSEKEFEDKWELRLFMLNRKIYHQACEDYLKAAQGR